MEIDIPDRVYYMLEGKPYCLRCVLKHIGFIHSVATDEPYIQCTECKEYL